MVKPQAPIKPEAPIKPQAPIPEHFGTTGAEVARTTRYFPWDQRLFFWCWAILFVACGLRMASELGANEKNFGGFVSVVIVAALTAFAVTGVLLAGCFALQRVLVSTWPQYRRVAQFHAAQAKYRGDFAEYNASVLRQLAEYNRQLAEYNARVLREKEQFWRSLDGISFERELGQLFRKLGYQVTTTSHTADGGVDLILERSGQRIVVQCKSHASKVGIGTARELVASIIDFRAQKGILAVTSGVTRPVADYVKGRNIEIYDLHHIISLQREHG
jgi:HJR/Mrr/RecB family endonuclease